MQNINKFGIEIEFDEVSLMRITLKIKELYDNNILTKKDDYNYPYWNVVEDESITYTKQGLEFGGEVVSPILTLDEKDEIKLICDALYKAQAVASRRCGGHIHFSSDILENNPKYFYNLMLLWSAYEDVIYKFGYNGEGPRIPTSSFATPIYLDFEYKKPFIKTASCIEEIFHNCKFKKNYGLNFCNFFHSFIDDGYKSTIEVRSPNGTIDYDVWINNINFFMHLFQFAKSNNLDIEKLEYMIFDNNYPPLLYEAVNYFNNVNIGKAYELANMIYDKTSDKEKFIKQYKKTK